MANNEYSYVTVLSNAAYIPGVIALINSLKNVKSQYPLTILVPDDSTDWYNSLKELGCQIITRPAIKFHNKNQQEGHYWDHTFFKLAAMSLTEFKKIVLLDSDMLIMQNIDHLFDSPHMTAVMDRRPFSPNYALNLNSGLIVIEPNSNDYLKLINLIELSITSRTADGLACGDQDVFHSYVNDWADKKDLHLPETYNVFFGHISRLLSQGYFKSKKDIYVVHFIGRQKPWQYHTFKTKLSYFWQGLKNRDMSTYRILEKYVRLTKKLK